MNAANPTMPTPGSTLLLTEDEAAKQLRTTGRTVFSFRKRGLLRCVKLGKSVRYRMADLEAFIDTMAATTATVEVHVEGAVEVTP